MYVNIHVWLLWCICRWGMKTLQKEIWLTCIWEDARIVTHSFASWEWIVFRPFSGEFSLFSSLVKNYVFPTIYRWWMRVWIKWWFLWPDSLKVFECHQSDGIKAMGFSESIKLTSSVLSVLLNKLSPLMPDGGFFRMCIFTSRYELR